MTLTLVQLVSISVYSIPLLRIVVAKSDNNNHSQSIPDNIYWKIIVPLAVGKCGVFIDPLLWSAN